MTTACDDLAPLLASAPLDLLEPAERATLEAHLAGCPRCADALARLRGCLALPEATPAPGSWERLAARIAAEQGLRGRVTLACTWCHDGLARGQAVYCAACLAPHHADCFRGHGRCSTPGCESVDVVAPRAGAARARRWRGPALGGVALLLGAAALARPERRAAAPAPVAAAPIDSTIAVSVKDALVRDVLLDVARRVGLQVVLPADLTERVTCDLRERSGFVLFANVVRCVDGLELVEEGPGLLRVVRAASIEEQVQTQVHRVQHQSPTALLRLLRVALDQQARQERDPTGRATLVELDPGGSALVVTGPRSGLVLVAGLLERLDVQPTADRRIERVAGEGLAVTVHEEDLALVVAEVAALLGRELQVEPGPSPSVTADLRCDHWLDALEQLAALAGHELVPGRGGEVTLRAVPRVTLAARQRGLALVIHDLVERYSLTFSWPKELEERPVDLDLRDVPVPDAVEALAAAAGLVPVWSGESVSLLRERLPLERRTYPVSGVAPSTARIQELERCLRLRLRSERQPPGAMASYDPAAKAFVVVATWGCQRSAVDLLRPTVQVPEELAPPRTR